MRDRSRLAWGILGTGHIAQQYATGVNASERSTLVAVGSRMGDTARVFAGTYHVPRAYGSYDELLADAQVQAVYVSLPNSMHHEWTIKALRAGKHVLCEKPLATNLAQAQEMFEVARQTGRILVEAFMYRSHPYTGAIQEAIAGGCIGKVRMIRSSFSYAGKVAGNVRFSNELAGGALMDVGCYCLSYSRLFAGAEPTAMAGYGHIHASGVDDYAVAILNFPGDIVATFTTGMTVAADNTAYLLGSAGYMEIPTPWKPPMKDAVFAWVDAQGVRHQKHVSANKHLYALEADDVAAAVLDGAAVRVTKQDSLGNQACLDELRRQAGVQF